MEIIGGKKWITAAVVTTHKNQDVVHNSQTCSQQTTAFAVVTETIIGREAMPCNIRGVKAGLRPDKQKLTAEQFHQDCARLHRQRCLD